MIASLRRNRASGSEGLKRFYEEKTSKKCRGGKDGKKWGWEGKKDQRQSVLLL